MSLNRKMKTSTDIPLVLGGDAMASPALGYGRDALVGGSIRIPITDTAYGATFGGEIKDSDREYAALREPIGHFTVHFVAKDVLDNWFEVDDPETKDKKDPELNLKIQKLLKQVNAKKVLTEALEYERTYGYSLIVGQFNDASTQMDLAEPLKEDAQLLKIVAYPRTKVTSIKKDRNINSVRFGKPEIYYINRGTGYDEGSYTVARMKVHYTRVIRMQTRTGAVSALDAIWDDLTTYRNERWALGQTLWRYGSGYPILKLTGFEPAQLRAFNEAGMFSNLMSRTHGLINEDMEFDFKGAMGSALDPAPYTKPVVESMAIGTRVPEPILRGAQAGALTGSEVNEREYFKLISTVQSDVEPDIKQLITWVLVGSEDAELSGLTDFDLEWLGGVELGDLAKAQIEYLKEQTNSMRLQYMTPDEVRKLNEIETELPDGEGAKLKGAQVPQLPFGMETELPGMPDNIQVTTAAGETFLVRKLKQLE